MAIPLGARRSRWTPRRFARSDIGSWIRSRHFLESLPRGPVTRDESPSAVRDALDLSGPLPESGMDPAPLLERTAQLLFDHSLFNGHPRFFGYITAPPAPIGMLGDFLAAAVNPNVGAWMLSPAATEIESQTVRWIAALIGYPADCGGLLVSGGNMANFVCFLAARAREGRLGCPRARRRRGFGTPAARLRLGRDAHVDSEGRRPCRPRHRRRSAGFRPTPDCAWTSTRLRRQIDADVAAGDVPCLVVGTAGSVSTGAVDPLPDISAVCKDVRRVVSRGRRLRWVRGRRSRRSDDLRGLSLADSVAVDPHKWLYAPLEAGCALVRDPEALRAAFAYHPPYYHFEEQCDELRRLRPAELARLPRAQGVAGAEAGRRGGLPPDDRRRHPPVAGDGRGGRRHAELQLTTQDLSITTFRYVPRRSSRRRSESQRSNAISMRSTARCSIGCSAEARPSSRTRSSAAATCCAPAS